MSNEIKTPPANNNYRNNWDRIFAKSNVRPVVVECYKGIRSKVLTLCDIDNENSFLFYSAVTQFCDGLEKLEATMSKEELERCGVRKPEGSSGR